MVEEEHLEALYGLRVLFMPRVVVTDAATEERLSEFVRNGGTLVCESECGAFGSNGLCRYPEDGFIARLAGVQEVRRRTLPGATLELTVGGERLELGICQWITPWERGTGQVWAEAEDGDLIVEVAVDAGHVILCGSHFGDAYRRGESPGFERVLELVARGAEWTPDVEMLSPRPTDDSFVHVRYGQSLGRKVVFFPEGAREAELRFRSGFFSGDRVTDLISGRELELTSGEPGQTCTVPASEWRFCVLVEG